MCHADWQSLDTSCYGHFKDEAGLTWLQAEKSCQAHNAHLVSIGSEAEVAYLHHLLTTEWMDTEKDIYIGEASQQCLVHLALLCKESFLLGKTDRGSACRADRCCGRGHVLLDRWLTGSLHCLVHSE